MPVRLWWSTLAPPQRWPLGQAWDGCGVPAAGGAAWRTPWNVAWRKPGSRGDGLPWRWAERMYLICRAARGGRWGWAMWAVCYSCFHEVRFGRFRCVPRSCLCRPAPAFRSCRWASHVACARIIGLLWAMAARLRCVGGNHAARARPAAQPLLAKRGGAPAAGHGWPIWIFGCPFFTFQCLWLY